MHKKRNKDLAPLMLCTIVCAVIYLSFFDLEFLLGNTEFLINPYPSDFSILVAAINYYLKEDWTLQIVSNGQGFPQQIPLYYFGAFPLLSLFFKVIRTISNLEYNYLGLWYFLSIFFQYYFSYKILDLFAPGRRIFHAILASVVALAPGYIFKFPHAILFSHFTVLGSIYFSQLLTKNRSLRFSTFLFALLLFSFTYDPYTFLINFAIFSASHVQILNKENYKAFLSHALKYYLPLTLLTIFMLGIFGLPPTEANANFFHKNSSNLVGFFIGNVAGIDSKLSLNFLATPASNYHGYNYLGLGVIIALAFSLIKKVRWPFSKALTIVAFLLFIVSLSGEVYLAQFQVLSMKSVYSLVPNLEKSLRAPGRFSWLLMYLIMLYSLTSLQSLKNKISSFAFLFLVLLIQFIDIQPITNYIYSHYRPILKDEKIKIGWDSALFSKLSKEKDLFLVFPTYLCGPTWSEQYRQDFLLLQLVESSKANLKTNNYYTGRQIFSCSEQEKFFMTHVPEKKNLYFINSSLYKHYSSLGQISNFTCKEVNNNFLCF